MFQPAEETRDRAELETLQLERLRQTVARIAAHNEHYHRHLGKIAPRDLVTLRDLRTLPLLTKDHLRDARILVVRGYDEVEMAKRAETAMAAMKQG
jgi:phenylacetate-CoA ligase